MKTKRTAGDDWHSIELCNDNCKPKCFRFPRFKGKYDRPDKDCNEGWKPWPEEQPTEDGFYWCVDYTSYGGQYSFLVREWFEGWKGGSVDGLKCFKKTSGAKAVAEAEALAGKRLDEIAESDPIKAIRMVVSECTLGSRMTQPVIDTIGRYLDRLSELDKQDNNG